MVPPVEPLVRAGTRATQRDAQTTNALPGVAGAPARRAPAEVQKRFGTRRIVELVALAGVAVTGAWGYTHWHEASGTPRYVTAPVTRGAVVHTIVTTGTISPVVTVEVGTYVSGVIQKLDCDFNTPVTAGQRCAKIDPRPYQVVVDQDRANLASVHAQRDKDAAGLVYAKINYERDAKLEKKGIVSQDNVDNDKSAYDQARAQVAVDDAQIEQRNAELHAAEVSLDYTDIVSPVDGVVVSRNIEVGQTVAASFQTPTLFLIAQDLSKMQVDANVSEADIGGAKAGEKASFTVDAYPDKTFWGQVVQVRAAPISVQNVITYDVVVGFDNPDLELLPGMTANVRLIAAEHDDVVRVPMQALRYSPAGAARAVDDRAAHGPQVWVLRDERPEPRAVILGLSDEGYAEITDGQLPVGTTVILDEHAETAKPLAAPPWVKPARG